MRFKNWLLTGTSIGLLALAPISANAQDTELQTAYQAYLDAQASGDAAATTDAEGALKELCIVAGYASLEDCIAALSNGAGEAAPAAEQPAPETPAPQPDAEQPPAEEPAAPEPENPAAAEDQAAPAPDAAPAEQAAPTEQAAPEQQDAAPATEPAPAAEEPAPQPAAEPAPAQEQAAPAEEQPAPTAETQQTAPEAAATTNAETDYGAEISAQVDAYNAAVADLMAGGDTAGAQTRIDDARAQIASLCAEAGFPDMDACLANFGLELPPVPALDSQQPAPATDAEANQDVGDNQPAPVEETTANGQPAELVENLPEGVTAEQIAPVLDSAKDEEAAPAAATTDGKQQPQPQAEATAQTQAEPAAPAPTSDQEAQARLEAPQDPATLSATAEQGEQMEVRSIEQSLPQNVTIINQTNITNNVSTGDNSTVAIGQQTNQPTENNQTANAQPIQPVAPGEAITQLVLQIGSQLVVNSVGQDTDRFYNEQQDEVYYERLSNGRVRETITKPDGSQIVTVRNRNGDVLRRSRIMPDGREYILASFDDRYDDDLDNWRDPGANLPPLRLTIPVREYVLDAEYADENEVSTFFRQPPVEQVNRIYSIDEVKRSARIRDTVRRLEVGNLTFDTGSATISRDQVGALSKVANAMLDLLEKNPAETFLIEGHTDAVGSDISNLKLSDLRAATIARILTDFYGVPPENLATQGYGERYLKIRTESAERENRRVTIRRITPLITVANR